MAQVLATFTATLPATFARSRTTMPATFATFPETLPATLAESHARRSSRRRPPRPHRLSRGQPPARPQGHKDGGKLEAQAESRSAGDNDTPQGHKQGPQNTLGYGSIEIAQNIKTHYRCIKMANMAYSRKAAGIHQQQRKTPHSVSHAGQGYFWSFARSSSSRMGCNRIYNKIKGGTSFKAQ